MPTQPIFLGRQPILDREQRVVAYELLFRSGNVAEAHITDDVIATASVIRHAFSELGIANVLGPHQGFINLSADMLLSDAIELLPPQKVVLELLETIAVDADIVARCRALKALGYRLALDDFVYARRYDPLLDLVDVVKVDLTLHPPHTLASVVAHLRRWPVLLLAEKVDSAEQATQCQALGFDLFQGYYFARPSVLTGARARPAQTELTELLTLGLRAANDVEIEAYFAARPALAANLLRLIDATTTEATTSDATHPAATVGAALALFGRRPFQRCLQLLPFTLQPGAAYPSPLLLLAAARAKAMQHLAEMQRLPAEICDAAFVVGSLSLIEGLFEQPLGELVAEFGLDPRISTALLARGGELGLLLKLVESAERGDLSRTLSLLRAAGLSLSALTVSQIDAMVWVNPINEPGALRPPDRP